MVRKRSLPSRGTSPPVRAAIRLLWPCCTVTLPVTDLICVLVGYASTVVGLTIRRNSARRNSDPCTLVAPKNSRHTTERMKIFFSSRKLAISRKLIGEVRSIAWRRIASKAARTRPAGS